MTDQPISDELRKTIEMEIQRLEGRALRNKRWSDIAGAVVIILGACSGALIAVPDKTLESLGMGIYRQILPILTAAAYAALRYYRWGDKHLWYWYQRHRMKGLLVRGVERDAPLAREFADILLTAEANYPQPIYTLPESTDSKKEQPKPEK